MALLALAGGCGGDQSDPPPAETRDAADHADRHRDHSPAEAGSADGGSSDREAGGGGGGERQRHAGSAGGDGPASDADRQAGEPASAGQGQAGQASDAEHQESDPAATGNEQSGGPTDAEQAGGG